MKPWLPALLVLCAAPAFGHRLDEYLQATLISVDKDRVHAQITLTPGIAVLPMVLAGIDSDRDGEVSDTEQRAYAGRVLRDVSLSLDGKPLAPRLLSMRFPGIAEMKEGRGGIQLEIMADLPRGGRHRKLVFENHHQEKIAAYLVNSLVPSDPDLRLLTQTRSYTQSYYELDYVQTGLRLDWAIGAIAVLLGARFVWLLRKNRQAARLPRLSPDPTLP